MRGERRPVGALAMPLDVPEEVHAPRLRRRPVAQRAQRNPELGRPAGLGDARLDFPAAVPARRGIALVADLRVVLDPGGVGAEDEAVLLIAVRVEDDLERIHLAETGVAARVGRHDLRRIAVVHQRAHIDRLVVVDDADFGALPRPAALRAAPPARNSVSGVAVCQTRSSSTPSMVGASAAATAVATGREPEVSDRGACGVCANAGTALASRRRAKPVRPAAATFTQKLLALD